VSLRLAVAIFHDRQMRKLIPQSLKPCKITGPSSDWIRSTDVVNGVELFEAWFKACAYHQHRHDTYAICLTKIGVQAFDNRGAAEISTPGKVVVLHPDEMHDGHAGTEEGLGYHMLYVAPALICEAVQVICGRNCSLPYS
jgi:hypothetical protein